MAQGGVELRLFQTIQEISTENSSTVILPFPADLTGSVAALLHGGRIELKPKEEEKEAK